MKRENGGIILSASDLMRFQGCRHATTLDLGWLDRAEHPPTCGSPKPAEDDESAELLQKKGDAHERAFLAESDRRRRATPCSWRSIPICSPKSRACFPKTSMSSLATVGRLTETVNADSTAWRRGSRQRPAAGRE